MIYSTKRFSFKGGEYVEFIDEKGKVIGKNGKTQYLKTAKNKVTKLLKTKKGKAKAIAGTVALGTAVGAGVAARKKYMTEKELKEFSEFLEERNYAFNLGGLAKSITNPVANTWKSGALGKAKVMGGATLGTAAALGTAGAMVGNHMVNNDNNEGL